MIHVEDWAEIRRLHRAEQMPIRAIARHLGISKNTVKRALAHDRGLRAAHTVQQAAPLPEIVMNLHRQPSVPSTRARSLFARCG
ncbi:hypothetical protein GZL_p00131 (plasmid) [Streptomyces sp. 769]|nr:hypothetical protein GZL_p00131 [Streptomyces sp. 769]